MRVQSPHEQGDAVSQDYRLTGGSDFSIVSSVHKSNGDIPKSKDERAMKRILLASVLTLGAAMMLPAVADAQGMATKGSRFGGGGGGAIGGGGGGFRG
ncbi:hypothetical protein ACFQ12_11600, partial [Methylobacterium trifolii]